MSCDTQAAHSDESLLLTAKEVTLVHHAAIYRQSFQSFDCRL